MKDNQLQNYKPSAPVKINIMKIPMAKLDYEEYNKGGAVMKKKKVPYSLSQLKVSGRDLTSVGLKGRTVGDALKHLLHFAIRTGELDSHAA